MGHRTKVHALSEVGVLWVVRILIPALDSHLPCLALVAPAVILVKPDFDFERVAVLHHLAEARKAGVVDEWLTSCLVVEESVGGGAVLPAVV